jgi:hypothetical protein
MPSSAHLEDHRAIARREVGRNRDGAIAIGQRLQCIDQDVDHDLLDLLSVPPHGRQVRRKIRAELGTTLVDEMCEQAHCAPHGIVQLKSVSDSPRSRTGEILQIVDDSPDPEGARINITDECRDGFRISE